MNQEQQLFRVVERSKFSFQHLLFSSLQSNSHFKQTLITGREKYVDTSTTVGQYNTTFIYVQVQNKYDIVGC